MLVSFSVNGKSVNLLVHRIVATCFLPNPDNLPEVNHIDCNRSNNIVSNLEWCDRQYNNDYKEKYGISAKESTQVLRKPLFAVNLETLKILHFESQAEASRQLGVDCKDIFLILEGKHLQAKGYWFTEDKNEITKEKIQEIKDNMRFHGGIIAVNLETFELSYFKSQMEAERKLGILNSNISSVIKGRYNQTHGYWFCRVNKHTIEKVRAKFGDEVTSKVENLIVDELKSQ